MLDMKETPNSFNIKELFGMVLRHKVLIALMTAAALFGALLFHYTRMPVYDATSMIMIKNSGKQALLGDLTGGIEVPGENLQNDIELLKSLPLAEEVVRYLYAGERKHSLELFGRRSFKSPVKEWFESIFGSAGGSLNAGDDDNTPEAMRAYAAVLQSRIKVDNQRGTDILTISVSSPFPDEAALLANTLSKIYQQKDIEWNVEQATSVNKFVADQLGEQQQKVAAAENTLSGYMEREDIYELTGNAAQILEQLVDAESRHNDVIAEANILRQRLNFVKQKLSDEEKALGARIAQSVNGRLRSVQERIRAEQNALRVLVAQKGEDDAEVKAKEQQIEAMKAQLGRITRTRIAGELASAGQTQRYQFDLISEQLQTDVKLAELDYSAQELLKLKNSYEEQLNQLPRKQLDFARLQRDREVVNNTYTFLKEKLDESRIEIASEVGEVVIVGEAYPPGGPVSPNFSVNILLGLIAGLGLSGLLVAAIEMSDHTIRDGSFLQQNGFVELAKIPFTGLEKSGISLKPASSGSYKSGNASYKPVFITESLSSAFAESFRDLRTGIAFSRAGNPPKSVLVTGTAISEGKSTVCTNLALSFALTGKRVLVVDCDLRRPTQHTFLNAQKAPGLSDYLTGQSDAGIQTLVQSTGQENLFLIASGSPVPNPNELLCSAKMTELVRQLEAHYDMVLLDSPPLLLLSDSAVLSQAVEGVLLTARTGYTDRDLLLEVKKLDYLKPRLLGVALIGKQGGDSYGRYGYKYKAFDHYVSGSQSV